MIDWLLLAYIELFRCTPLLVQIIWFYYAFPVVIGVNVPANVVAVTLLPLYGGAFYAEIVRGSIESVHCGQWDAAPSTRNGLSQIDLPMHEKLFPILGA